MGPVGEWLDTGTRMLVGRVVAIMPLVLVAVGIATILAHPLMAAQPLRPVARDAGPVRAAGAPDVRGG